MCWKGCASRIASLHRPSADHLSPGEPGCSPSDRLTPPEQNSLNSACPKCSPNLVITRSFGSCGSGAVSAHTPLEQGGEPLSLHLQKRPPSPPPPPLQQLCPVEDGDTQLCGEVRARVFTCCLSLQKAAVFLTGEGAHGGLSDFITCTEL